MMNANELRNITNEVKENAKRARYEKAVEYCETVINKQCESRAREGFDNSDSIRVPDGISINDVTDYLTKNNFLVCNNMGTLLLKW